MTGRRRVLVVRAGALGDVLLLRPALASLKAAGCEVVLLAPSRAALLLAAEVDAVWSWDSPDVARLLGDEGRSGSALARQLDTVDAALAITQEASLLAALGRHVARVEARCPRPPTGEHAAAWVLGGARALGGIDSGPLPSLSFPEGAKKEAARVATGLPERFLAIHPGSGSATKNWPAARFLELSDALSPGAAFALIAGPADADAAAAMKRARPAAQLLQDVSLDVVGALLGRAGIFVGNDSGISHLAAASGVPTCALFGPSDPAVWGPIGATVLTLRAPEGDLSRLATGDVATAARRLRSGEREPRDG